MIVDFGNFQSQQFLGFILDRHRRLGIHMVQASDYTYNYMKYVIYDFPGLYQNNIIKQPESAAEIHQTVRMWMWIESLHHSLRQC